MTTDKVDLLLEAKQKGLKEALLTIENLRKEATLTQNVLASYTKTFGAISQSIASSNRQAAQFFRDLGRYARGSGIAQIMNAEFSKIDSNLKAQTRDATSAIVNRQMTSIREARKALEAEQKLAAAGFKGGINNAEETKQAARRLMQIEAEDKLRRKSELATERSLQKLQKAQEQIQLSKERADKKNEAAAIRQAKLNAAYKSPQERAAESRAFAVERVTGDAGASLFKIQASLLVNYTLMNQMFNLFQFGTQFVLELDKSFQNLQATIAATNGQMVGLKQEIIDVSQGTKFTAVEVAQAAEILGQAGFSVEQIKSGLQGVTLLATATGSTLAQSVDVASSAVGIFNLRAEDLNHVANVMTASINDTKLTMDKLALGLQYVGNTAAEAGLSFEETTAVLGAMSNAGIRSGSTLGTGFRQLLTELISPSEKFAKSLSKVGLGIDDVDVKSKGFVGVMQTLSDAGFTASDAFESLDLRAAAAFAAIQNDPEIINRLQESFLYSAAAAKANETQMKSLSNTFDQFRGALGTFINAGAGPLVQTLQSVTAAASQLLIGMTKLGPIAGLVGTSIGSLGIAIAGLKLVELSKNLFAAEVAAKGLSAAFSAASIASGGNFAKAIGAILSPIGKLTIAITAAVTAFAILKGILADDTGLDQFQTNVANSRGEVDKTQESIIALDENMERLINRFAELKDSPESVRVEFLTLQDKFGDLGFKINNETNPSIEDLIDALRRLKKELGEVQTAQLGALLTDQALLFQKQAEDARKKLSSAAYQSGYKSLAGIGSNYNDDLTRQNQQAVRGTIGKLSRYEVTDIGTMTPTERTEFKGELSTEISKILEIRAKLNKAISALRPAIAKGDSQAKKVSEAYEEASKLNSQALEAVQAQFANLSKYTDTFREAVKSNFGQTPVVEKYLQEIDDFNMEIAELRKKSAEAKDDKTKMAIANKIKELEDKTKLLFQKIIDEGFQEAISEVEGKIGELPAGQEKALQNELETKGVKAIHEANEKMVSSVSATLSAADAAIDNAQNLVTNQKEIFERLDDAYEARIKGLDAIMAEVTDLERGGLAGKYTDAELSIFEDRKKGYKMEGLKARIDGAPAVLVALDNLIAAQGGKVAKDGLIARSQNTPDNAIALAKSEKELLATQRERADVLQELQLMQEQYNAMLGIESEAHVAIGDQIQYVLGKYADQMRIQQQLGYNIKENITQALDDGRESFSGFLTDFLSGTKSISDSWNDMITSMLQSMLKMATDKVAAGLFGGIIDLVLGSGSGSGSITSSGVALPSLNPAQNVPSGSSGLFDFFSNLFARGGFVPMATGGMKNRDSVPAMLKPGEYVLRNQAVDMIGRENLDAINGMGARVTSQSNVEAVQSQGGMASVTNVWVVSPDQQPGMGPNDVIVTIADDIAKGGTTKKLIKQVIQGG